MTTDVASLSACMPGLLGVEVGGFKAFMVHGLYGSEKKSSENALHCKKILGKQTIYLFLPNIKC